MYRIPPFYRFTPKRHHPPIQYLGLFYGNYHQVCTVIISTLSRARLPVGRDMPLLFYITYKLRCVFQAAQSVSRHYVIFNAPFLTKKKVKEKSLIQVKQQKHTSPYCSLK